MGNALIAAVGVIAALIGLAATPWLTGGGILVVLIALILVAKDRRRSTTQSTPPPRIDLEDGRRAIIEGNRFKASRGSLVRERRVQDSTVRDNEER